MEHNDCIVCLDNCNNKNVMCTCVYYVHNECLQRWRINTNKCLLCNMNYPPLTLYLKLYSLYYKIDIRRMCSVKVVYYCIYILFLYKLLNIMVDLIVSLFMYEVCM